MCEFCKTQLDTVYFVYLLINFFIICLDFVDIEWIMDILIMKKTFLIPNLSLNIQDV